MGTSATTAAAKSLDAAQRKLAKIQASETAAIAKATTRAEDRAKKSIAKATETATKKFSTKLAAAQTAVTAAKQSLSALVSDTQFGA